jgi:hypothetical protein
MKCPLLLKRYSALLAILLAGSFLASGSASATGAEQYNPPEKRSVPKAALRARKNIAATPVKRQWGIEVLDLHQTSAGYMLQFRYRVLDPKAAMPLFDRKTKPYLIDITTGAKVVVPSPEKVGALRNLNPPETGRIYWMLFANPAKMIKKGSPVSVHIGDFDSGTLIVDEAVAPEHPVRSAAQ